MSDLDIVKDYVLCTGEHCSLRSHKPKLYGDIKSRYPKITAAMEKLKYFEETVENLRNGIPENLRNSSKSLFKEKVHTILLKIFEVQDRYADLNTIITDLKKY